MQSINRGTDPEKAVTMRNAPTNRLLSGHRTASAESSRKTSGGRYYILP